MFSRKFAFACVLLLIAWSPGIVCAQSAGPPGSPRPTPKPSPTPTKPIDSSVTSSSGGVQATSGQGILGATATPTPKPKPSPTPTVPGPVGPTPGGPQAQFNGVWTLDKAKSEGLSSLMQSATSITWKIAQDDKTISIDRMVVRDEAQENVVSHARAGGGRGFGASAARPAYNLDGTETTLTASNFYGGGSKSTLKAAWLDGALNLFRKTTLSSPDGDVKSSEDLRLLLSDDGSVLTAKVHTEGPQGATDMTLVFKKQ